MADSQKYGRTANLFDDEIESGFYNDNGELVPDTTTSHSTTYIPVDGTTYTISGLWTSTTNFAVYEWDNNKNWLRRSNRQVPASSTLSFTVGSDAAFFTLQIKTEHGNIMLNIGSTALPYQPYNTWQHSLRKLTTATEAVENPLYSDGTAITSYTLKGNTVQNGTPTPSNPVDVNGVGVRTDNLIDYTVSEAGTISATGEEQAYGYSWRSTNYIEIDTSKSYTLGKSQNVIRACYYDVNKTFISREQVDFENSRQNLTVPSGTKYIRWTTYSPNDIASLDVVKNMNIILYEGTDNKPYEPYGYKIPISSGGVTTNIYLGSTQTVRQIKKLVLTGQENWEELLENDTKYFQIVLGQTVIGGTDKSMCTHFVEKVINATTTDVGIYVTLQNNFLRIRPENVASTSSTDFKSWLAAQYSAGTPVTMWCVLATDETATVNEPLMKIGDYADTLSNATAIPTTEGANSITVDTTVQPSEFTATWTGWHNASVKEKSENLFDERIEGAIISSNGVIENNAVYDVAVIPVIAGEQYTFAYKQDYVQNYVIAYYTTKPVVGSTSYDSSRTVYYYSDTPQVTITVPNGVTYIALRLPLNGDLMLNSGSTALPYEPYWK